MQEETSIQETNEVLVKVEGISKKFSKDLKTGLKYGVQDVFGNLWGKKKKTEATLRPKEFWAVKDINFELRRGECLGLIGHNGAGKSTLLKILNGLINPDAGSVTIRGRVGALIELGAGFNPILTGRENIYNNGAVLGFSRKEIDSKLEAIIAFAELDEFIDMPVQHYSSGMKVRLGFAVAAQMEPDVLIIDEVLAVGDLGFVLKCFKTIDAILPYTAVIFVSHSMPMVSRICTQIILMDKGASISQGTQVSKAIDLYYGKFQDSKSSIVYDDGSIELVKSEILNSKKEVVQSLSWKSDLILRFYINNISLDYYPEIRVFIYDKEQRSAGMFHYDFAKKPMKKGVVEMELIHRNLQFSKGVYYLSFVFYKDKDSTPIYRINSAIGFQVLHDVDCWSPLLLEAELNYMDNE